ncbi:MAG: tryptophan synthase subunit alpha [Actinomycetota bacterium]
MTSLERQLRDVRSQGRKALVPYFMAGITEDWLDYVRAAVDAGADAIEIGLPFSDPIIDGVIIQNAANVSLERGSTMTNLLDELTGADVGVPLIAMSYFNIFHSAGIQRSVDLLESAGISGTIVPDLSLEEVGEWRTVANRSDLAVVLMVAPSTPRDRALLIARETQGFCYAAARMAVTGLSSESGRGSDVVSMIRDGSDVPSYIGIGITTAEQASEAARQADGIIVGSLLVGQILEGARPSEVAATITGLRQAID